MKKYEFSKRTLTTFFILIIILIVSEVEKIDTFGQEIAFTAKLEQADLRIISDFFLLAISLLNLVSFNKY